MFGHCPNTYCFCTNYNYCYYYHYLLLFFLFSLFLVHSCLARCKRIINSYLAHVCTSMWRTWRMSWHHDDVIGNWISILNGIGNPWKSISSRNWQKAYCNVIAFGNTNRKTAPRSCHTCIIDWRSFFRSPLLAFRTSYYFAEGFICWNNVVSGK